MKTAHLSGGRCLDEQAAKIGNSIVHQLGEASLPHLTGTNCDDTAPTILVLSCASLLIPLSIEWYSLLSVADRRHRFCIHASRAIQQHPQRL